MTHHGTVRPGSTLEFEFATYATATGASITQTGLAVTDIEIYKDGSVTQRSSDNGYTLLDTDGIDFDGITGIHGFSVSLADNSVAGFYAAGSRYVVVVSTITVDGNNVSFIAGKFNIGYESAILNTTIATLSSQTSFTLTAGPAEDDALNGMEVVIHDVASAVQLGRAVILDYTGSTKTVTLAAGTTFTAAATDNISVMGLSPLIPATAGSTLTVANGCADADLERVAGSTTPVTNITTVYSTDFATNYNTTNDGWVVKLGNYAHGGGAADLTLVSFSMSTLSVGVAATIDSLIVTNDFTIGGSLVATAGFEVQGAMQITGNLSIGGALSAVTNSLPWTAAWDAEVQSECQDAITASSLPTAVQVWAAAGRTLTAIDEDSTTLDLDATIRAAVGMSSANLDTQIGDVPTNAELATAIITALTTALTEGYRTAGSTASVRDMLYEIIQGIHDSSISGTTKTIRNLAGSAAKTFTLDHATTPTSITETT